MKTCKATPKYCKTRVTQTLKKFGAKPSRDATGDKRILKFDKEQFDKFCAMFDVPEKIKVISDTSDMSDTFLGLDSPKNEDQETLSHAQNSPKNNHTVSQKVSEASEVSQRYYCPYSCGASFTSLDGLQEHGLQRHREDLLWRILTLSEKSTRRLAAETMTL